MSAGRPWRITATAAPGTPAWLYSAKSRSIALVSAAEMTLGGGSALAESCQVASAIMAARTTTPTVVALRASSLQAIFLLSRQYLASLLLSGEFSGLATGDLRPRLQPCPESIVYKLGVHVFRSCTPLWGGPSSRTARTPQRRQRDEGFFVPVVR